MNLPLPEDRKTSRVLYVVYWGVAEPLGQSLVVPAVNRLAQLGSEMTLMSFEKQADFESASEMARIRSELAAANVSWVALRYHKTPKWPATLFDVLNGVARGLWAIRSCRPGVIHARTFVGGTIGMILSSLTGIRFLYHNEGFYPDEQVDGGVWSNGSAPHRLGRWLERIMYSRADAIIAMSRRGAEVIRTLPAVRRLATPVEVVPSCVDLDRFKLRPSVERAPGALRLVYVGSIGGRYIFDRVGLFVAAGMQKGLNVRLRVLTPAPRDSVRSILALCGIPDDAWSAERVPHAVMPAELAAQDAGLMVLSRGISEHGCSPTKVGEYWAVGLPVVITPNIGDTQRIVEAERVGVILRDGEPMAYERALEELLSLLRDPDLATRCREAAERHYALTPACALQVTLYRRLLEPTGVAPKPHSSA